MQSLNVCDKVQFVGHGSSLLVVLASAVNYRKIKSGDRRKDE